MKELNLLIVEDDSNVIATYTRDIDSYNKTNSDIKIEVTILSDKDQAIDMLKNSKKSAKEICKLLKIKNH